MLHFDLFAVLYYGVSQEDGVKLRLFYFLMGFLRRIQDGI